MKIIVLGCALMLLLLLHPSISRAIPASPIEVTESTRYIPPDKDSWFLRIDGSGDLAFQGARGIGLSGGHLFKYFFLDFSAMYYQTKYKAIQVYQPGANFAPLDPNSEIGVDRSQSQSGPLYSIGPGIGFMFKLFQSEKWVEMGRFGLNYARYSDSTRNINFQGMLANFQGAVGYRLDPFLIAPGLTWNLGYVTKVNSPGGAASSIQHNNFLPIQWWALQVSVYYWVK